MKQRTLTFAAVAALAVCFIAGDVFAQAVPSLVTQQMRLSSGGVNPNYVQHRSITTVGPAPNTNGWYAWDQVPNATAGENYLLFLNDQNEVRRTTVFTAAQSNFLARVNSTGTNIEFIDPALLTTLNGDIIGPVDSNEINPNNSGISNRSILAINADLGVNPADSLYIEIAKGGTNSSATPTAGAVAYGDGSRYQFTSAGTAGQVLISQGSGAPIWSNVTALINAYNGLTVRGDTVLLGGPLIENTTINTAGFNMEYINASTGSSTFTLGNSNNTFNVNINVGTNGDLNLQNIDVDTTAPNILVTDATGNVRTRSLASFVQVDADNGLTATTSGAVTTVHMGSAATGGAPLLSNRFIDLASNTLNYEGSGTVNVGTGGDVNLAVNTGATGNMSIQGTTLNSTTNFNNILYTDGNNVRRATTAAMDSIAAPNQFITIDANGNIGRSASPTVAFFRGQIAGTGTFQYTVNNINIQSGAAINLTVENHTGVIGAIVAQVTSVTNGTNGSFSVETSENIQTGSFINYTVINP